MDIEYFRNHPIFWSLLGFPCDPPMKDNNGKPLTFRSDFSKEAEIHHRFEKAGIRIHTCVLHSGWVGVNEYDYSLTDSVMDELFRQTDGYFIPRVKLNVPIDWCRENPEEVFTYKKLDREEIRRTVGTLKQDILGYERPGNEHYNESDGVCGRPNEGGIIALQSISSKKWLKDAGEALRRLIEHIEVKYGDRVLGYHIAYGPCGETMLWGRQSERYGDYGIANLQNFYDYGINKYQTVEALEQAWEQLGITRNTVHVPSAEERYADCTGAFDFFRGRHQDIISRDFDEFISFTNAEAVEHFGKIVKENTNNKVVGVFYGYYVFMFNASYGGHLAIDKILNSPYVDFIAAPKSYYRCKFGEPGGEMTPTQSINRKKLWVDEIDIRTHIAKNVSDEWKLYGIEETRWALWREFFKNLSHNSGFWWMDLGGGWYDSDEIMQEVRKISELNEQIRKKEYKSISDVLVVTDEKCIYDMKLSNDFRQGFMEDFIDELHLTGALVDAYRLSDLPELDLSQYRLIVFAYDFRVTQEQWKVILDKLPQNCTVMFNYAFGIVNENGFSFDNVRNNTGFEIYECGIHNDYPEMRIVENPDICALILDESGKLLTAERKNKECKYIYNTMPYFKAANLRKIAETAGCKFYASLGDVVYGDSRAIGIFAKDKSITIKTADSFNG